MLDPFEPGPNFGNFSGSPGGNGFNGTGGFGAGRQGSVGSNSLGGANPFGGARMGGRNNSGSGPLFPSGGGGSASFSGAPLALPSLNQLMRGSVKLPLNSSSSTFRLSYQDTFRPGGDLGRPSASAMFSSSDLGNGVFLSAGTTYGSHMAGAPAATLGNGTSGGPKRPGPGVALKLSF